MAEVSFAGMLFLPRFDEPLGTVLPQSFKQSIPQPIVVKLFDCHQRLVDELLNTIERIALRPDRFGRSELKAAGKNRKPPEQSAFLFGKQIVAPVNRRSQRFVAAASSGQKPESIR